MLARHSLVHTRDGAEDDGMNHKKLSVWLLATFAGLACVQACSESSDNMGAAGMTGMPDRETTCMMACDVMAQVSCPGDVPAYCIPTCEARWGLVLCTEEVREALICASNRPASAWECDADEESNLKAGHCESEIAAVSTCSEGRVNL